MEGTLPGVAEGAYTVVAARRLADRHGVDMPLAREVHAVLYEGKDVASLADLVARGSRDELAGCGPGGRAGRADWPFDRLTRSVGVWRSLVAHLTGGQEVAGSNPVAPTSSLSTK